MTTIAQGQHAYIFPEPGQVYRVQATGVATVQVIYGAPSAVITLDGNSQTFGPYDSPAKLRISANTATADYTLLRANYAELTAAQVAGGAVGVLASNNSGGVIEPDGDVPALGGSVASTSITDSTAAGRAILTAANAAAQRTSMGAMTSNLPAMQAAFDAGTTPEKSAFQASVSGDRAKLSATQQAQQTAGATTALLNTAKTALVDPLTGYDISLGGTGSAVVTLPGGSATLAVALTNTVRAIRQAASHKHCIILVDSDSTSNGLAATASPIYPFGCNTLNAATILGASLESAGVKVNRTRWAGQMGMQLSAEIGLKDPRVSGVYTETFNQSAVCGGWQTITVGNKRSYMVDSPVDRAQFILITQGAGGTPGTVTVDINGGAPVHTFNEAIAASTVVSAPINLGALLKPGDVINVNAAVGTVMEIGLMAWNSHQPGVTILNNGGSGKSAQQAAATGTINSRMLYSALNTAGTPAALVLVSLILNSLANDSVTYQGYLQTLYTLIKAASSATDVVFYDGPQCATAQANSANFPTRVADAKTVATTNSCAYISMNSVFGASPGTGGGSIYYITDNVGHMTALGYEELYRGIARPIIDAVKVL